MRWGLLPCSSWRSACYKVCQEAGPQPQDPSCSNGECCFWIWSNRLAQWLGHQSWPRLSPSLPKPIRVSSPALGCGGTAGNCIGKQQPGQKVVSQDVRYWQVLWNGENTNDYKWGCSRKRKDFWGVKSQLREMDFVKSPEYVLKMLLQQRKSFSISTSRKSTALLKDMQVGNISKGIVFWDKRMTEKAAQWQQDSRLKTKMQ